MKTEDELPPEGIYVLVHLPTKPWGDSDDEEGVHWKVAKFVRGLTVEERKKLSKDDPRIKIIKSEDEWSNNHKGYCWKSFGPGNFFGQEVTEWHHLPFRVS